ncbi:MAG TPA: MarP family serine protease [Actinomycetota bacterium]|nr:MarP family serine protease [Actinomycetota bacterium]
MSFLDLVLVALLVLSAIGGYRRGALLQGFGLGGVIVGLAVAAVAARSVAGLSNDPFTRSAIVLAVLLVGMAIGNLLGWLIGSRVRKHVTSPGPARADAVGGAALSVGALLLAVWFVALNLLHGPFPAVSSEIRTSAIVRTLDDVFPPPPSLLTGLERAADLLGLQNTFVGLPPLPAPPVPPPSDPEVAAAAAKAQRSTVEILADGCQAGYRNEGSGFVIGSGLVVTNAHVVAGTDAQAVLAGTARLHADVVLFDPELDIAILHVTDLNAPSLALAADEVERGAGGAILGFPGGAPLRASAAAVRRVFDATGRDIYGRGRETRRIYELQADVHPGNSGGPFVLPDGRVAGIVFASSRLDDRIAYAIVSTQVVPLAQQAAGHTQPVSTGPCVGG